MSAAPRVVIFGAGYVGLATAVAARANGSAVIVLDSNEDRVRTHCEQFESGRDALDEPNMNIALGRVDGGENPVRFVAYSADAPGPEFDELVRGSVAVCAVGTPIRKDGSDTDASAVVAVARLAAGRRAAAFVIRSTVSPRVLPAVREALRDVPLVVMPEFLREGHAVADAVRPSRIVFGADPGPPTMPILLALGGYNATTYHYTNPEEAALVKLASNTALSLRVWLADSVASVCEGVPGADSRRVLQAVYADGRLGTPGVPGLGAAGPCLPKDTAAFGALLDSRSRAVTEELRDAHETVPSRLVDRIWRELPVRDVVGSISVLVRGVGFKPDSTDWRGSPVVTHLAHQLAAMAPGVVVWVQDDRVPQDERDALAEALAPAYLLAVERIPSDAPGLLVLLSTDASIGPMPPPVAARHVVVDPYRLTCAGDWPGSKYLGGGLGPRPA